MRPNHAIQQYLRAPATEIMDPEIAAAIATQEKGTNPPPKGGKAPAHVEKKTGATEDADDNPDPDRFKAAKPKGKKPGESKSSMGDIFKKALAEKEGGKPAAKEEEDDDSTDPPAKETSDKKDDLVIKKTEGKDPIVSSAVTGRFDAYKATEAHNAKVLTTFQDKIKAYETELETLRKGAGANNKGVSTPLEEQEGYKSLKADHDALLERLERVNLLESPRFKAKYTDKLIETYKSMSPFVKSLDDPAQQEALANDLSAIMNIPHGEEGDAAFFKRLDKALDQYDDLSPSTRNRLVTKMEDARKIINQKGEAESKWKDTAKEFGSAFEKEAHETAQEATKAFRRYQQDWETDPANAKLVEGFRKTMGKDAEGKDVDIFKYDAIINAGLAAAEPAIADSIKKGGPTPELLKLVHKGIHGDFSAHRLQIMIPVVKGLMEENAQMRETIAKLKGSKPGLDAPKAPGPKKTAEGEEEKPKSMLDILAETRRKKAEAGA